MYADIKNANQDLDSRRRSVGMANDLSKNAHAVHINRQSSHNSTRSLRSSKSTSMLKNDYDTNLDQNASLKSLKLKHPIII